MRLFLEHPSRFRATSHKPSRPYLPKKGANLQVITDANIPQRLHSNHARSKNNANTGMTNMNKPPTPFQTPQITLIGDIKVSHPQRLLITLVIWILLFLLGALWLWAYTALDSYRLRRRRRHGDEDFRYHPLLAVTCCPPSSSSSSSSPRSSPSSFFSTYSSPTRSPVYHSPAAREEKPPSHASLRDHQYNHYPNHPHHQQDDHPDHPPRKKNHLYDRDDGGPCLPQHHTQPPRGGGRTSYSSSYFYYDGRSSSRTVVVVKATRTLLNHLASAAQQGLMQLGRGVSAAMAITSVTASGQGEGEGSAIVSSSALSSSSEEEEEEEEERRRPGLRRAWFSAPSGYKFGYDYGGDDGEQGGYVDQEDPLRVSFREEKGKVRASGWEGFFGFSGETGTNEKDMLLPMSNAPGKAALRRRNTCYAHARVEDRRVEGNMEWVCGIV